MNKFCHFCHWSGESDEDVCPECGHQLDVARIEAEF